ncbi:hypothetical protein MT325_m228L [Paramecium bursaria chlorella virus MT325]|uniref:Uncharacterized protein m228L n=1 Tax=Paramecium bursaria Chlorella virus MT325 TaxID=346932 RepID=A7ITV8_PBCVM|nr:hypothetical protein MT325_m228L [Paramecium bursaria chlorella virus MT325]
MPSRKSLMISFERWGLPTHFTSSIGSTHQKALVFITLECFLIARRSSSSCSVLESCPFLYPRKLLRWV